MNTMAAQSAPTFSITSVTVGRHGEAQGTEDIALTFDEVKDQLKEELLAEKQRKAYESRINQLKILFPVDRF